MARKRAREEPAEDQQPEPAAGAVNIAEVQAAALVGEQRRQATARDVARRQGHCAVLPCDVPGEAPTNPCTSHCRRAAHFAHFNTEDDSAGAANIHAGGSEVCVLGVRGGAELCTSLSEVSQHLPEA